MLSRLTRVDWLLAWLLVALVAIFLHGPVPLYSTRTLGVAWEMWARGDFLLPIQNGLPYSHKPPTLYWLIHAGWALFGVSDVWPRVLVVLLGALSAALTAQLGVKLYPERPQVALIAPWILLSGLYFFLFAQQIMFELLLVIAVLCAYLSAWRIWHGGRFGRSALTLSLALGLLTKGPVVFLHVLPGLLLLPFIARRSALAVPRRWRLGVLGCALAGSAIALAWALPAALSVGPAFAEQLLIGQTAGRIAQAFDHARPLWWYLPWIGVLGFPWLFHAPIWRGLAARRQWPKAFASQLLLAWTVPAFVGFCLVSGKQVYYLLPLMPAFALALAKLLDEQANPRRAWLLAAMLAALALGLLAFGAGWFSALQDKAWYAGLLTHATLGAIALLVCSGIVLLPASTALARTRVSATAMLLSMGVLKALFSVSIWPTFNLQAAALQIAALHKRGALVASIEHYEGQYHFAGRLTQPIIQLSRDRALALAWASAHPEAYLLLYPSEQTACALKPIYAQAFRNQRLELWQVDAWRRCGAPFG